MLHSRTDKTNWALDAGTDTGIEALKGRVGAGLASAASLLGAVASGFLNRIRMMQQQAAKPKRLELVETLALGGKRQLFVITCDNQRYLVGAGAESVGTIVPIETRSAPVEKTAKRPHLVRERGRDTCRIVSAEPVRRRSFEAISETGDLWQ